MCNVVNNFQSISPRSSQNITHNNDQVQDRFGRCKKPCQCISPAEASHKSPSVIIVFVPGWLDNEDNNIIVITPDFDSWSGLAFTSGLTMLSLFNREGIG